MSFWKKKEAPVEHIPEPEPEIVDVQPLPGEGYDGPVVFSDGHHWPIAYNEDGSEAGPNLTRRLLWNAADGVYRYAFDEDPTHAHLYQSRIAELVPGGDEE